MVLEQGTFYGGTERILELEHFYLTLTVYEAGAVVPRHSHENPYLSLLLAGNYAEEGRRRHNILQRGHSIFRPGAHEHANTFDAVPGKCFNVELKSNSSGLLPASRQNDAILLTTSFLDIYRLYDHFLHGATADTMDLLSCEIIQQLQETQSPQLRNGRAHWIQQVKAMVNDAPEQPHTLDSLAQEACVHPNYLLRKFREKTGWRLSEYITRVRLEKALQLLLSGNDSMAGVAAAAGFYDESHFSRSFRAHFHLSPARFRKMLKG